MELRATPPPGTEEVYSWGVQLTGQIEGEVLSASLAGGDDEEQAGESWYLARSAIGTAQIYHLRAEQIAAAAYSNEPDARIKPDGKDTAEALAAMKLGNDEVFQRVEDALRSLIPTVERVRIRRETVQHSDASVPGIGSKLYFDVRGAPGIPAHGASHGTLIVLALLAILHGPNRPRLILLDDFDHALHPRAQMELVRMIMHLLALEELKDVQVVATTHSPYTLDELDPIDVYAFALCDDGTVASRRLSEHPEAESTRGTLKAGQLWSLDPERDWVLRG
jgi:predicted ATPase